MATYLFYSMAIAQKLYRKAFHLSFDIRQVINRSTVNHQDGHHGVTSPTLLQPSDKAIVHALQTEGAYVTSLNALDLPNTHGFWSSAQAIAHRLPHAPRKLCQGFRIEASAAQLLAHPDIICWGLGDRILSIVEHYLQSSVALCGVVVRRDVANTVMRGTRLWHRDIEDRRMCKVIVYLNDVTKQNGPFAYIARSITNASHALKGRYGYIRDQVMQSNLSSVTHHICDGSSGNIIICDTASVFHRGIVPVEGDRLAAFFTYVTRDPRSPWKCHLPFRTQELGNIINHLTPRQQQSIFWKGTRRF